MASTESKILTPFGEAALALDHDFSELDRLSKEIEKHSLGSDSDMERARKLFARFSECGQRIGDRVQGLAKTLEEARTNAERAAESVSQQAAIAEARQQKADALLARFQSLGDMARQLTRDMAKIQPAEGALSTEDRASLISHLPTLCNQLDSLITAASKLRDDTRELNMKTLEKDAHALTQSLQSVRRRLDLLFEVPAASA